MSKGRTTDESPAERFQGVSRFNPWYLSVISFILGSLFALGVHNFTEHLNGQTKPLRLSMIGDNHYRFIDPLISSNVDGAEVPEHFEALHSRLKAEISQLIEDKKISAASIYVRDFNSGTGLEVYSGERYNPASLLKVPIMMAFYKIAEGRPGILREQIMIGKASASRNQDMYPPQKKLQSWSTHSVSDLIGHMILYSDNDAATALVDFLNNSGRDYEVLNEVFNDLGVHELRIGSDFIDPKTYSLFLRVLYNATYLNREMSEKALYLLSRTDFNSGIRAGIPTTTPVSHKFGEFTAQSEMGIVVESQLHDCGIVYAASRPFALCIMTKGEKFDQLSSAIAQLSKIVYEDAIK
jgi:beta-lactamase class A